MLTVRPLNVHMPAHTLSIHARQLDSAVYQVGYVITGHQLINYHLVVSLAHDIAVPEASSAGEGW